MMQPTESPESSCKAESNEKSCLPRARWKILSKAVKHGLIGEPSEGSIRQFDGFPVISVKKIDQSVDDNGEWFSCCVTPRDGANCQQNDSTFQIRLLSGKLSLQQLSVESDTTGNVCLWPSEKILTYYCYKNLSQFDGKVICELGGGMTSLTGLMIAVKGSPRKVILSDGNERCVGNIQSIIKRNALDPGIVDGRQIVWGQRGDYCDLVGSVDFVLIADCLYYEESHHVLLETIADLLNEEGKAIILAPRRGKTFSKFVERAAGQKFKTQEELIYDQEIWKMHEMYLKQSTDANSFYKQDLHYPIILALTKIG